MKHSGILVYLSLFAFSIAFAAGPEVIGVVTSVPAANASPAGKVVVSAVNAVEISGRVTGGSGVLHILRKTAMPGGSFQFRPWAEDRPIDPFERVDTNGYFSARVRVPANTPNEEIVLLNPGGTVVVDATVPLVARGVNY